MRSIVRCRWFDITFWASVMDYGLYVAASGADTQSRRMEVLSHNLANVDTPGFKEELAILQARYSQAIREGDDVPGRAGLNDLSSGVSMTETTTNFTPGTLKRTGQPWDMAIQGEGFFAVEDDGRQLLTRAGNFRVSNTGELLTSQGFSVLDVDSNPIVINPSMYSKVHQDGWIEHSGGGQQLAIVKPQSLGDLVRTGDNAFHSLGPVTDVDQQQRQLQPGFIEISDVKPTRAMMELIETSRIYEANVRMVQSHDQITGALVNRVLSSK